MDGPTLSRREQLILADIEEGLRADAELERRLRTMRLHRWWHVWQVVRGEREIVGLVLLGTAAVLLVIGIPAVRFTPVVLIVGLVLLVLVGLGGMVRPMVLAHRRRHPAPTRSVGEAA